jgi:putative peptide zinc metalloprotease protein
MMTRVGTSVVAASAAIALVFLPATTAAAGTRDNVAIANTNARHRVDVDVSFQITHDHGPVASANNLASATGSNCTGCRTIAIAIQIDLVSGVVTKVNAQNLSLAQNFKCVQCETLADAHQFIVASGGEDVDLTDQGRAELEAVRRDLIAEVHSDDAIPELQAGVDATVPRIDAVLRTEVRSEGSEDGETHVDHRDSRSRATLYNDDRQG